MPTRYLSAALLALVGVAAALPAQARPPRTAPDRDDARPRVRALLSPLGDDHDRPRLGLSVEASGIGDTLGTLVSDVTEGSPAEKAGIKAGDRLVAINGVNLRLTREDAEDEALRGMATRRLTRELARHKVGDAVELRVLRDGKTLNMNVTTVAAADLATATATYVSGRRLDPDRASLGIGLGSTGSKRDTLGILVASLVPDGPAEKAGLEEGDRIAAINGVDLRVAREDAGDFAASNARVRRLSRELEKVKAGDEVELRLYRAGQPRTVRLKSASARELERGGRRMFIIGDDAGMPGFSFDAIAPVPPVPPAPPAPPAALGTPIPPAAPRMFWFDGDGPGEIRLRMSPRAREEMSERAREAMERALELAPRGSIRMRPRVRVQVEEIDTPSPRGSTPWAPAVRAATGVA